MTDKNQQESEDIFDEDEEIIYKKNTNNSDLIDIEDIEEKIVDEDMELEYKDHNNEDENNNDMDQKSQDDETDYEQIQQYEQSLQSEAFPYKAISALLEYYGDNEEQQDELEQLRQFAAKTVLLNEQQWKNWTTDLIQKIATQEDENVDQTQVLKLFDKALQDGKFFEYGKSYAKFAQNLFRINLLTKNQLKIIYEKLISEFLDDFNQGSKFFKKLIKFETSQLEATDDSKQQNDIKRNIRTIYKRLFKQSYPDIDINFDTYSAWEEDQKQLEEIKKIYQETQQNSIQYLELDEQIQQFLEHAQQQQEEAEDDAEDEDEIQNKQNETASMLEAFLQKFLEEEVVKKFGSNRLLSIIESMTQQFPNFLFVYKIYADFILQYIPIEQQYKYMRRAVLGFYCHATEEQIQNQSVDLIVKYIRVMEKANVDREIVQFQLDRFLLLKIEPSYKYIIVMSICEYNVRTMLKLDRDIDKKNPTGLGLDQYLKNMAQKKETNITKENKIFMRQSFQQGVNVLKNCGARFDEVESWINELDIFRAQIETYILKEADQMRQVMENMVKRNGSQQRPWDEYYNCEMAFGNLSQAYSLLKRQFEYCKEDPQASYLKLLEFERKFAPLMNLEYTETALISKLEKALEKQQEQQKYEQNKKQKQENLKRKNNQLYDEQEKEQESDYRKLKKNKKEKLEDQQEAQSKQSEKHKKGRDGHILYEDKKNTIFIKNIPSGVTGNEIINLFENAGAIEDFRYLEEKGMAYIDFESNEDAVSAMNQKKDFKIKGHKLFVAISEPPKKGQKDNQTLFINNLPYKIDEGMIQDALKKYRENIRDIRIIREKDGRAKGYGYIEFDTEDSMVNCYEEYNNNLKISERKIFLQLSASEAQKNRIQTNNVVFLKDLSFKATEKDIQEFFEQKLSDDAVKKISIVKNDRGKSKGFAYVEFQTHQDRQKAILLKEGELHQRVFQIIRSDREISEKKEETKKKPLKHQKINLEEEKSEKSERKSKKQDSSSQQDSSKKQDSSKQKEQQKKQDSQKQEDQSKKQDSQKQEEQQKQNDQQKQQEQQVINTGMKTQNDFRNLLLKK